MCVIIWCLQWVEYIEYISCQKDLSPYYPVLVIIYVCVGGALVGSFSKTDLHALSALIFTQIVIANTSNLSEGSHSQELVCRSFFITLSMY